MSRRLQVADPYIPQRGNAGYRVTAYDLDLGYTVATNQLEGRARINAVALEALNRFDLDLVGLRVRKLTVAGAAAHWVQRRDKLRITPAQPVRDEAEFVVDIRYAGQPRPAPSPWGRIGWEELQDGALVAAQPIGAATWFPCNDLAAMKVPFRIAMTTASPYRVVSNGRLAATTAHGSKTTWVYEQTEPMSPYLAALHVGRYDSCDIASNPVAIRLVFPPQLRAECLEAFARQEAMLEVFSDSFGPYPFEGGYTVVVTPDVLELPVEAQGLSTFGSNHLDGRDERLIAHELAHQWFGNSLTAAEWNDVWLHEGFACYAEWLWSERSGGAPASAHARQHYERLRAQSPRMPLPLRDPGPDEMFADWVYKRGALTVHALRAEIGDRDFFALLPRWTDANRHGVVTTASFVAAAETIASRPLGAMFEAWLDRPALPPFPASSAPGHPA